MANEINAVAGQLWGVPVGQVYTAGKGVVIDNVHKTVRVDETVLYDKTDAQGATLASPAISLSETVHNFERIKIYWRVWNTAYSRIVSEFDNPSDNVYFDCLGGFYNSTSGVIFALNISKNTAGDALTFSNGSFFQFTTTSTNPASNTVIYKVVGINRISS